MEGLLLHGSAGRHQHAKNHHVVPVFLPIEHSGLENEVRIDIFPLQEGINIGSGFAERTFR